MTLNRLIAIVGFLFLITVVSHANDIMKGEITNQSPLVCVSDVQQLTGVQK